jgi:putative flavoprotein involved in K+ transport
MLDAVVIGAGHAGLAVSQRLAAAGLDHVVLERGAVGESWRAQRWDSFHLNTPNRMNALPGTPYAGDAPDAFEHRDDWVARLERYVREHALPVRTGTAVRQVRADDGGFRVVSDDAERRARTVIVAAGVLHAPKLPPAAATLDPAIARLTTGTYRGPAQLPPGAVLVVGSAQSGVQIAEDLLAAGRTVYLATGKVGRAPRRLRGRDTLVWMTENGWLDQRPADLPDPAMVRWAQPQISGVGPAGHTVSYRSLRERGVTLLGRVEAFDGTRARFAADLPAHVAFADEIARRLAEFVDEHIARRGIAAPPSDPDPANVPADPGTFSAPAELDLRDRGIAAVIFSTGFGADLSWLQVPALDADGTPRHTEGVTGVPGLWFVGLPWMRTRKSGIIWGAREDSEHIVAQVRAHLG